MRRLVLSPLTALVLAVPSAVAEPSAEPYLVKDIEQGGITRDNSGCNLGAPCGFEVAGSVPSHLTAVGDRVFFLAWDHPRGRELWVSDGTEEGTRLAVDLELDGWEPAELIGAAGDRLVYRSFGLWATDGTPEGTLQLAPHQPWPLRAGTTAVVEDLLYFAYDRGFSQPSWLWRSDGTPQGTFPVELPVTVLRTAAVDGVLVLAVRQMIDEVPVAPTSLWRLTANGETTELARACGTNFLDLDFLGLGDFGGDATFYARCVEGAGQGQGTSLFTVPATGGAATLVADRVETWKRPLASWWEAFLFQPSPPTLVAPPAVIGERLYFGRSGSTNDELWSFAGGELRLEAAGLPGELRRVAAAGARPLVVVGPDDEWHGVAEGAVMPLGVIDGGVAGFATPDAFYTPAAGFGIARLDGTVEGSDVVGAELWAGHTAFGGVGDRVYFEAFDTDHGHELWALPVTAPSPHGCAEDAGTLCLAGERFAVSVTWRDPRSGDTGAGVAVAETADAGFFWFFDPANLEVLVKVLDATTVNGHHWVFHGSLTDVGYQVRVEDLATGAVRTYDRPAGTLCGGADAAAFPADGAAVPTATGTVPPTAAGGSPATAPHTVGPGGRFSVAVEWLDPQTATYRPATIVAETADSAWAWFFDPANVEVFLKVLDARVLDGRFWVFHGGLTDLAYRLTVTDGATGATRVYDKPAGSLCGGADTAAF